MRGGLGPLLRNLFFLGSLRALKLPCSEQVQAGPPVSATYTQLGLGFLKNNQDPSPRTPRTEGGLWSSQKVIRGDS